MIAAAQAAITFFIGTSGDTVPQPCYAFVTRRDRGVWLSCPP